MTLAAAACAQCGTELPALALCCPACGRLTHATRLRQLAADADALSVSGKLEEAHDRWQQALSLLPRESDQHREISKRIADLGRQLSDRAAPAPAIEPGERPWWKRGLGGAVAVGGLLLGKAKFLALGLLKAKTLFSMLAFTGVYWTTYGWPLACGLVGSIYIHEMGHVAVLRQLGIAADAPLFVPGIGALILLRQRIEDPVVDAKIGLAGPLWGLGAGIAAYTIGVLTGSHTFRAIAELTGFINLFNLTPVWQLDGSRGFHALSRAQRAVALAAIAASFAATEQKLLLLVGAVALVRVAQRNESAGDARTLATYVSLVAALSWLSRQVG